MKIKIMNKLIAIMCAASISLSGMGASVFAVPPNEGKTEAGNNEEVKADEPKVDSKAEEKARLKKGRDLRKKLRENQEKLKEEEKKIENDPEYLKKKEEEAKKLKEKEEEAKKLKEEEDKKIAKEENEKIDEEAKALEEQAKKEGRKLTDEELAGVRGRKNALLKFGLFKAIAKREEKRSKGGVSLKNIEQIQEKQKVENEKARIEGAKLLENNLNKFKGKSEERNKFFVANRMNILKLMADKIAEGKKQLDKKKKEIKSDGEFEKEVNKKYNNMWERYLKYYVAVESMAKMNNIDISKEEFFQEHIGAVRKHDSGENVSVGSKYEFVNVLTKSIEKIKKFIKSYELQKADRLKQRFKEISEKFKNIQNNFVKIKDKNRVNKNKSIEDKEKNVLGFINYIELFDKTNYSVDQLNSKVDELESLIKGYSKEEFNTKYSEFLAKYKEFKSWKEKNGLDYEKTRLKRNEFVRLAEKLKQSNDFTNIKDFVSLGNEVMADMNQFVQDHENRCKEIGKQLHKVLEEKRARFIRWAREKNIEFGGIAEYEEFIKVREYCKKIRRDSRIYNLKEVNELIKLVKNTVAAADKFMIEKDKEIKEKRDQVLNFSFRGDGEVKEASENENNNDNAKKEVNADLNLSFGDFSEKIREEKERIERERIEKEKQEKLEKIRNGISGLDNLFRKNNNKKNVFDVLREKADYEYAKKLQSELDEQADRANKQRLSKKYIKVYEEFKNMVIKFRSWREKNLRNIADDRTHDNRTAAIRLYEGLNGNDKSVEKMQKFIDSAKASMDEMKQFMCEKSANKVNTNTNKVVNNVQIERKPVSDKDKERLNAFYNKAKEVIERINNDVSDFKNWLLTEHNINLEDEDNLRKDNELIKEAKKIVDEAKEAMTSAEAEMGQSYTDEKIAIRVNISLIEKAVELRKKIKQFEEKNLINK